MCDFEFSKNVGKARNLDQPDKQRKAVRQIPLSEMEHNLNKWAPLVLGQNTKPAI